MVLGIDLGTTYSAISYLDKGGNLQIVLNKEKETITPSLVFVEGDKVTVGKQARKKAMSLPKKICRCVKRLMGFRETVLTESEKSYSPEAVSAIIIRRLIEDALLQNNEPIEGIVVTVPTYFNDTKRTATRQAVEVAVEALPIENKDFFIEVLDEPKAAGLYYCYKNGDTKGTILVYDLGGGTFDTALLEVDEETVNIVAVGEEHEAGGAYFDDKIREFVIEKVKEKYGIDLRKEEYASEREVILLDAEIAKKQLSNEEINEVNIVVCCQQKSMDVILTKDHFNELIDSMVHRTENTIQNMLEENGTSNEEINQVVLVGGSSRIPYVRKMLENMFPGKLVNYLDPDKAITYGAAIYAGMLLGKEEYKELKFQDICAHEIGILILNEETGEKYNDILIHSNAPVDCMEEREYQTAYANQTYIKVELTESENVVSKTDIKLPRQLPIGTKVNLGVKVNKSHFIEVFLSIPSIDFCKEYSVKRTNNLTEEEKRRLSGLVASRILD